MAVANTLLAVVAVVAVAGVPLQAQPAVLHGDPTLAKRSNLGGYVNSTRAEILPVISADGNTLYFDRKYDPRNTAGRDDPDDIYMSRKQPDGTWSVAENVGPPLNTSGSDVLFWVSADGNTVLVHNGASVGGRNVGLAIARRTADGSWGMPVSITIDGLDNLNEHGDGFSACISPDGRRLIVAFASDTLNQENLDLYSCAALGNDYLHWSAPVSLGERINSLLYEWAPSLAADNETLYFASGGLVGFGASDIYVTRRLDSTWTNWSEPENMGPTINTVGYEASLMPAADGVHAYMSADGSSSETGYGKTDIYYTVLPETLRPRLNATVSGVLKSGSKRLQGLVRVVDGATGTEVASAASQADGSFSLTVAGGRLYRVTGWAEGYREQASDLDLRKGQRAVSLAIALKPGAAPAMPAKRTGVTAQVKPLPNKGNDAGVGTATALMISDFGSGAEITAATVARLRAFVVDCKTLYAGQVLGLQVIGYHDGKGPEAVALAERRAEAVRAWLAGNGLAELAIVATDRDNTAAATAEANAQVVISMVRMR